jgi:thiamine transporter ThiT
MRGQEAEKKITSMVAIVIGAFLIGCEYGAATGWGVGLIAYGLREIT